MRRAGGTILSMPRGPSDVRTASATALAATMLLSRTLPGAQTKSDSWGVATPEASGGRAEPQLAGEGEAAGKRPLLAGVAPVCCDLSRQLAATRALLSGLGAPCAAARAMRAGGVGRWHAPLLLRAVSCPVLFLGRSRSRHAAALRCFASREEAVEDVKTGRS